MNICAQHPQIAFLDTHCPVCREQARVRDLEIRLEDAMRQARPVSAEFLSLAEVAALLKCSRWTVKGYQDLEILPQGRILKRADVIAAIPAINKHRAGHSKLVSMEAA